MHHHMLGEGLQWALYRHRERLDRTEPPVAAPPRSHPIDVRRSVPAVISALAISALLSRRHRTARAAEPERPRHHRQADPNRARHLTTAARHVLGPVYRHPAVPLHHLKETLR